MTLVVDCKHRGCFWLKVDVNQSRRRKGKKRRSLSIAR